MGLYKWLRGTRENLFGIGDGLDTNKGIEATIPGATKPTIRYNTTSDKWELSQDGITYVEVAAVGSIDHGGLLGLLDDDHTQYVLADGTRAINELYLTPKVSSTGAEGTMFYDSDDDHVWVATE